ncbi:3'(2'),5'-bisphosphate nucleotidase CysQ [Pseudomonas sp. NY15364]|uniref:3'(2'),5'-bisphosphate nucleotidase CysQ n=1 Tax=Pseudomonas sp. NY15364 TaxID=3400353 RepID=UPI003A8A8303
MTMQSALEQARLLACEAGQAIMAIYARDFTSETKADASPLTEADLASHRILVDGLQRMTPDIPVLSEESADIPWETRQAWERYWLIDPLDGTKEFIKRNGEFTVNIALIEHNQPALGVVFAPALGRLFSAASGLGAWHQQVLLDANDPQLSAANSIAVNARSEGEVWRVVGSRSHAGEGMAEWLAELGEHELVSMGSSLKLCLVADGTAHVYPRLGPTCEWDTAAAHAVVLEAGGQVLNAEDQPLLYNTKAEYLNPHFFVWAS